MGSRLKQLYQRYNLLIYYLGTKKYIAKKCICTNTFDRMYL